MTPLDLVLLIAVAGGLSLAAGLVVWRGRRGFVWINQDYREFLCRQGFTEFGQVQALPAVIVCGHPDRHVTQVTLGSGAEAIRAFLKREHRVPWKDRCANARAGFGFVSKSYREALLLTSLQRAGISCPEVIAAGEDRQGHAFLLLRELTGARELRLFLQDQRAAPRSERRRFARQLGMALARMHDTGFDHPDLYSKHVLVQADGAVCFLDWQRSRRWQRVNWRRRCRDLAALDATLSEDLATARERLVCLRAYLRGRNRVPGVVEQIRQQSQQLLQKRRIQELRQPPLVLGTQNLIWLDGEALCVTREFLTTLGGKVPSWLTTFRWPPRSRGQVIRTGISLPGGSHGDLVRRQTWQPFRWLWSWVRQRPLASPELRQAGTLFRLQRYGVATPQLLAVGQRHALLGRTESFLLTEPIADTICLKTWWDTMPDPLPQRWSVIRQVASLLRQMHVAGCYLGAGSEGIVACPLRLRIRQGETAAVVLGSVDTIQRRRGSSQAWACQDLAMLCQQFSGREVSRTEQLRFVRAYLGLKQLTPAAKQWVLRLAMRCFV